MFGFFRKKIHEPLKLQHADLARYPDIFVQQIVGAKIVIRLAVDKDRLVRDPIRSP